MPVEEDSRLRLLEAPKPAEAKRERVTVPRALAESSAKAALAALKKTTGVEEILRAPHRRKEPAIALSA